MAGVQSLCLASVLCAGPVVAQTLPCPPEQAQQLSPPCEERGSFGASVALDGDRLAVGGLDASGGRVKTFTWDSQLRLWQNESTLRPAELRTSDGFAIGLHLHDDSLENRRLLAAGSPYRSDGIPEAGKAYVFANAGSNQWVEQSGVLPNQSVPYGWFGNFVTWATASQRRFLVVGAPGSWGHQVVGSVYVFEEDGNGQWQQLSHLQAPNGSPENDYGNAIAAAEQGGTTILLVGAAGSGAPGTHEGRVYCYAFDDVTDEWVLEANLEAPDPYELDQFGKSVSVAPVADMPGFTHRAAVGRRNEGGFGSSSGPGAVYLYLRADNGAWQQEAHLVPPLTNVYNMSLGHTVELARDGSSRLLVGAINSREFGAESGGALIYERDDVSGEWSATQALYGREQDSYDAFAVDLALGDGPSADMAVVGALATQCPGGSQFDSVGAVYIFDLDPGNGGNCPAPVITLQKVPDCSSGPGGEIEVRWFQATPDQRARIALLYAKRTGNFVIPNGNPCSGTALELGQLGLQVAHTGSAGQFGAGRIKRTVPRSVCGGYLQLVDITRCATSNIVRIE